MKKIFSIILVITLIFSLTACVSSSSGGVSSSTGGDTTDPIENPKGENGETAVQLTPEEIDAMLENQIKVVIDVKDFGEIDLVLFPDVAPITVENFVNLANEGFYDGLTFHRIIQGFMIQGGDPNGNGTGGAEEDIYGEFLANGFTTNFIPHQRGVISMARGMDMDSASSQFFICDATSPHLDGNYAAFGMVSSEEGIKVVDEIAGVEVDGETPVNTVTINTIKVITE